MSISSAFLWRFLEDVWDLLPSEDRGLFEAYWRGQIQTGTNIQQKVLEANLSRLVEFVPVYLTERWEKFTMEDGPSDIFQTADSLVLSLLNEVPVSRETIFSETLTVSNAAGQISHEETAQFFDSNTKELRYGRIVNGTFSIMLDDFEFVPNRDYAVNLLSGRVTPLLDGRIPPDQLVTIRYQHKAYARGIDYEVNEIAHTIRRVSGTAIANGETVVASYAYNNTPTVPMLGTTGSISGATLTDTENSFSGITPGRTVVITEGLSAGSYTVTGVLNPTQLQVAGGFPADQSSSVKYSINAFPHGVRVNRAIASIPFLQDRVEDPTLVLIEGQDYAIQNGILASRVGFPLSPLGPEEERSRQMWAETTLYNRETPYRNFGVLIDFFRENSRAYKLALQGLWYTFWTGSTTSNLERGLQILLGLPFAREAGTVTRVDEDEGIIEVTQPNGVILSYTVPSGLEPEVVLDQEVARFDVLTTGVNIRSRNSDPGFVKTLIGRGGIQKYLTSLASRGEGDTSETRALDLLENHLFIPEILIEAVTQSINTAEIVTFLDNLKPEYTDYTLAFDVPTEETLEIGEDELGFGFEVDLTATLGSNPWNRAFQDSFFIDGTDGEILGGGTQATGNFRDGNVSFVALGIDEDDYVYIFNSSFRGVYQVLARISGDTLSLDIPDALIVAVAGIQYAVVTAESRLDEDAVNLRQEHLKFVGANLLTPTTLNVKTDAPLSSSNVTDEEALALLLVDESNVGNEVQPIVAADLANNEFSVSNPPANPVAKPHEVASCALKRDPSVGATTAYAI